MNPFPYIEKWITEHGSAAALRDHVALLKSQMDDLKTKKADSDSRAAKAEAQVEKLQAQLDDAQKQIQALKSPGIFVAPSGHVAQVLARRRNRSIEG
jgi:hypothetical protein